MMRPVLIVGSLGLLALAPWTIKKEPGKDPVPVQRVVECHWATGPIMIDGKPMSSGKPAPRLGEHTAEILREIGEA